MELTKTVEPDWPTKETQEVQAQELCLFQRVRPIGAAGRPSSVLLTISVLENGWQSLSPYRKRKKEYKVEQTFPNMKPERVQIPSIFPQEEAESSTVTWKVNTGSFETSCGVANVISNILQNRSFQKAMNLSDEWIELWMNHATPEERAILCKLIPRLKGAVEHYLEEAGVHKEQPEILGA